MKVLYSTLISQPTVRSLSSARDNMISITQDAFDAFGHHDSLRRAISVIMPNERAFKDSNHAPCHGGEQSESGIGSLGSSQLSMNARVRLSLIAEALQSSK